MKVWPGKPYPLGAVWDGQGTNFSLFSEAAERVQLCLFDDSGEEEDRIELPVRDAFCWHGFLPDVGPGRRYGFRVEGPWAPEEGHRCDASKLLLDPYAKAIEGRVDWDEAVFTHRFDAPESERNRADSAGRMPRCVVIDPSFDWEEDRPPSTPLHETIIYEVHVKGFTARHPDVPKPLRGTYAGLAHPAALSHLKDLGITAVELMPVQQFVHAKHLLDRGLRNYWGYDSIGFFAPHNEYSSSGEAGQQVREFQQMVKALHREGIEVIIDVAYNHTAEGNHLGPTLAFKGIDNSAYYRLVDDDRRYYMDYTGTGNSLNMRHPHVLQLIMDSLRHWVVEMHVDGFRFDLASALARELHEVDRLSSFFEAIHQDPVVSQTKLIAEPWDVGEGGYQVGNFPPLWAEWNDAYRDTTRRFWRGDDGTLGAFARRLTGSSDLYEDTGRRPFASVNFVTAHDGFTLTDLVSYERSHDEANDEGGSRGEGESGGAEEGFHGVSWNCGVEGDTDDPGIRSLRARHKRNLVATLLLSQGVPMLLGGDEIGRTQGGNSNAYCQDNEITYLDWEGIDRDLLDFTRRLTALRRGHPVLRRRRWFAGDRDDEHGLKDVAWLRADGREMDEADWEKDFAKSLGVFLNGLAIPTPDVHGERIVDRSFLLLLNAGADEVSFELPGEAWGASWECVVDTASTSAGKRDRKLRAGESVALTGHSLVLLHRGS